ncbi:MAG: glycosyltransferase family 2 protein [Candidatus Omnitrophota bacterium]|jgi:glycosyltransferase involved in cell wall biosynthesis
MKLSIVIPVYNEIESIEQIIKKVSAANFEKEILIVDDGSSDGTREFLKGLPKGSNLKVFYHEINQGKTAAIRTAFKHISGDIVIIQDADLEYNPSDYKGLIRPIIYNKADVVYGSRFLYINKYLFIWHWFLNKFLGRHYEIRYLSHFLGIQFLNILAFILYGLKVTDIATGYKVFKAEAIKDINLRTDRFEFCYEITAKIAKKKLRLKETRIDYHPRSNLKGKKLSWKDGVWASWALIRFRFTD